MELEILKAIQSVSNPFLDILFQFFTMFGEELILVSTITIIYWAYDKKLGEYITFSVLTSICFNTFIKNIFRMPRPIGVEGIRSIRVETAPGYSFPSGHTQTATSFYGSVAIYKRKKILYIIASLIIFLVGLSRLYLGVHYPKDVICGAIFGISISLICLYFFNTSKNIHLTYLLTFLIFSLGLFFIDSIDFIKALGSQLGFVCGIFIEHKYVNFETNTSMIKKIFRVIIGLFIIIAIKSGLKLIFPSIIIFDFIRYTLISFVGIGVYPMLFKKLNF